MVVKAGKIAKKIVKDLKKSTVKKNRGSLDKKLTPQQERFIDEYVLHMNAYQAAVNSGYAEKSAYNQASRLMRNEYILSKITEKRKEISEKTLVTVEYVINGLREVFEKCSREEAVYDKDGEPVHMKFDSSGANKALELLGKHVGAFDGAANENNMTKSLEITVRDGSNNKRAN